tara:strand:- start:133 stop:1083 length:951 start_codon:yes stop_codon:yes gene_type:complete
MQYVLGVGFVVEKYKKNPNVRIFVDDRLIDEYEITDHESVDRPLEFNTLCYRLLDWDKKPPGAFVDKIKKLGEKVAYRNIGVYLNENQLDPILPDNPRYLPDESLKSPKKFKLFTIDESVLKGKKKINLEIMNDDSNHTNGFMTRSTLIDPRHIFLIPVNHLKFFKADGETFHKNMGKIIPRKYSGSTTIRGFKHDVFVNAGYPFPFKYLWKGEAMSRDYTIGGSGTMSLELKEKNGIVIFDPYEEELSFGIHKLDIEDPKLYDIPNYDNYKAMMMYGLPDKKARKIVRSGEIPAFPFSRLFFALSWNGLFDKYSI